MSTTEKRMTIAFTREQLRELEELAERLGEYRSMVIHRAVSFLHNVHNDRRRFEKIKS